MDTRKDVTPWSLMSPHNQAVRLGFNLGLEAAAKKCMELDQHPITGFYDAEDCANDILKLKEPTI